MPSYGPDQICRFPGKRQTPRGPRRDQQAVTGKEEFCLSLNTPKKSLNFFICFPGSNAARPGDKSQGQGDQAGDDQPDAHSSTSTPASRRMRVRSSMAVGCPTPSNIEQAGIRMLSIQSVVTITLGLPFSTRGRVAISAYAFSFLF